MNTLPALFTLVCLLSSWFTAHGQSPSINGSPLLCGGDNGTYYYVPDSQSACSFVRWSWSGSAEVVEGSTTIPRIVLRWTNGGGTIFAEYRCGSSESSASLFVTVFSVGVVASQTNVEAGTQITLSATGNSATTYSWSGAGLLSNSGQSVKAIPPAGTTTYVLNATKGSCSVEKSINVTATSPVCLTDFTVSASTTNTT